MSFSKKAAMDDSNAPKRGDVMQTSGDSPSKRLRGGDPPLEVGTGSGGKSGGRNGGNRGRGRGGSKGKGGYQQGGESGPDTTALVSAMARLTA